eukprot:CAMPEP_0182843414 /NCGR_PEP_ID=MMETSP0006_2-20121128/26175_1 /TAXON_ID=97485 /ORGANISM="Prymnesium parvum, Strain Texoma1" /LENGTH=82 /DNA_ID=CAMNT_0024973205 /DNA_START=222 /DNA_END=471 /DNA_ORIENTATION=-
MTRSMDDFIFKEMFADEGIAQRVQIAREYCFMHWRKSASWKFKRCSVGEAQVPQNPFEEFLRMAWSCDAADLAHGGLQVLVQ